MLINPISNTSFKGKYIDRSSENGGLWYMEYSPYSWESNNTSKMAPTKRLNILSDELPDNEEIYTPFCSAEKKLGRENSKDLFGTEFRFVNNNGLEETSGTVITPVAAMNLEESLRVQLKKLNLFLDKKHSLRENMQKMFEADNTSVNNAHNEYLKHSKEYDERFINKNKSKLQMDNSENALATKAILLSKNIKSYIQLEKSIGKLLEKTEDNTEMFKLLWYKRMKKDLIDISCADKKDQMKPLVEFLNSMSTKNLQESYSKLIALPHKVIYTEELLNTVKTKVGDFDFVKEVVSSVQNLIKKKI